MSFAIAAMMAVGTVMVPTGTPITPAAAVPVVSGKDSAEDVAKDAARDLQDGHYYNRPGATKTEFEQAWQECRLIARGSRTPSGTYSYVYNPALISPIAAGVGAGLGAAIAQAIIEGQLRRANRQQCLMIRGWRRVEVDDAERLRLSKLPPEEHQAYFASIVGAPEVTGKKVFEWHNDFAAPRLAPATEQ